MKTLLKLYQIQALTWQMYKFSLQPFKNELEFIINDYLSANKGDQKVLYPEIFQFQVLNFLWTPIFDAFSNFSNKISDHVSNFPKEVYFEDLTKEHQQLFIKLAQAILLFWYLCIPSLAIYYSVKINKNMNLDYSLAHSLVNRWFYSFIFFQDLIFFYDLPEVSNLKSSQEYVNDIFNLISLNKNHFHVICFSLVVPEQIGLVYDSSQDYSNEVRDFFQKYWSNLNPALLLFIYSSTKAYNCYNVFSQEVLLLAKSQFDFSLIITE